MLGAVLILHYVATPTMHPSMLEGFFQNHFMEHLATCPQPQPGTLLGQLQAHTSAASAASESTLNGRDW
jgi:hypothetical protein